MTRSTRLIAIGLLSSCLSLSLGACGETPVIVPHAINTMCQDVPPLPHSTPAMRAVYTANPVIDVLIRWALLVHRRREEQCKAGGPR